MFHVSFAFKTSKLTFSEEFLGQIGDENSDDEVHQHNEVSEGEPLSSVDVISLSTNFRNKL
jgi:hypothetical protein